MFYAYLNDQRRDGLQAAGHRSNNPKRRRH
jgi:hypothetical protein